MFGKFLFGQPYFGEGTFTPSEIPTPTPPIIYGGSYVDRKKWHRLVRDYFDPPKRRRKKRKEDDPEIVEIHVRARGRMQVVQPRRFSSSLALRFKLSGKCRIVPRVKFSGRARLHGRTQGQLKILNARRFSGKGRISIRSSGHYRQDLFAMETEVVESIVNALD